MSVLRIHHVQLAMPPDGEDDARLFYRDILGIDEVEKPEEKNARGGVWFESGALKVHLGVEEDFKPARKAHPCFEVSDLMAWAARLRDAGCDVRQDSAVDHGDSIYTFDPFGNRLEFVGISR